MDVHKDYIKRNNESAFLMNKEKVNYHSIILMEIFNFEDFPNLINGLKKLYGDLDTSSDRFILDIYDNVEEIQKKLQNPASGIWWKKLPIIRNSRIEEYPFLSTLLSVPFDLGSNITHIEIGLFKISSSLATLQINARLKSNVSDQLNNLIYKEYSEEELLNQNPDGSNSETFPQFLRKREITELRLKIKTELINHLSSLFKGQFFKLMRDTNSIVPSLDVISLNYPGYTEDIIKWGKRNRGFLNCFGISITEFTYSRNHRYLLCEETGFEYPNHIILANQSLFIKLKQEINFNLIYFPIIALNRLTIIHKIMLGELNATISNEIETLEENELVDVLDNRKNISKKIYFFKRFKIEFEQLKLEDSSILDFNFVSLALVDEYQTKLYDILVYHIFQQTKDIDDAINTLNQHSNIILNLKNIEYSRKMLFSTNIFTVVVGILTAFIVLLTVIQVFKMSI